MKRASRWALRIAVDLVLIVAGLVLVLVAFEKRFIYIPSRELEVTPTALGLRHEEVRLHTEDGVALHAWFLPCEGSSYTVLLNHGNAGNISHRLDRALLIQAELEADVLLYDYRGYGRSEGAPDEEGTYRDARAAWAYLTQERDLPPERILIFGESLGSAVALQLALDRPARALVLESPFTSAADMASELFPFLPMRHLIRTRYDNLGKVGALRIPLLILHGDRDEIVPFEHGQRLYAAAPQPKRFYPIPGAAHNTTYLVGGQPFWATIREFIEQLPPPAR